MGKTIFFSLLVIVLIVGGLFVYRANTTTAPVACTTEARVCPDGSTVGRVGPSCEFAPCPTVSTTAPSASYATSTLGFSISYPKDFHINESYTYTTNGPGKEIHGVSFVIPSSISVGTNLGSDSYVSVESLQGKKSTCTINDFLSDIQTRGTITENGVTYPLASSTGVGAGNYYEDTVYYVGHCQAVRYLIHSSNIQNYDPGTIQAFDHAALVATFDTIRRSYQYTGK